MRLRLTVQRNANGNSLPPTNVVWNVPDTNSATSYTIARLLEDVNHVIPLEIGQSGIEHYVVEVGGFECLHFSPVSQALKEDDLVCIRPLMTAEVRARTLAGRHQISDDGRHLVDGVPFGRPYLRHSNRPPVTMPPRKRRRLDQAATDGPTEIAHSLNVDEEDPNTNPPTDAHGSAKGRARPSIKAVHFNEQDIHQNDDDDWDEEDDEEDGQDFNPGRYSDAEDDSSSESGKSPQASRRLSGHTNADTDSESSSDASSESSSEPSSDSSDDSDSDSGSASDASSPPEILSSKHNPLKLKEKAAAASPPKQVTPGHGRKATRLRNDRRVRSNRLRYLKALFKLPQDADMSDLQKYEESKSESSEEMTDPSHHVVTSSRKRKRLDQEDSATVTAEQDDELARKKQELLAKLDEQPRSPPRQEVDRSQSQPASGQSDEKDNGDFPLEEDDVKKVTSLKRLRPDTAAIRRILLRQAGPTAKKAKTKIVVEEPQENEGALDPDFWKSRINLSAFECWDEDFELVAPPFPFKQHWDPASKLMRDKANKKKDKKSSRTSNRESAGDVQEASVVLDYDDTPAAEASGGDATAAIEEQLRQDVATASQRDLPPMPEDLSTLPELTPSDIKKGAAIVCKFLTVNPATVTPEISEAKISIVAAEGDSGNGAGTMRLQVQEQDLKRKVEVNNKGNRAFKPFKGKFFVDHDEEDEEDNNTWEGTFGELLEAKLLQAA